MATRLTDQERLVFDLLRLANREGMNCPCAEVSYSRDRGRWDVEWYFAKGRTLSVEIEPDCALVWSALVDGVPGLTPDREDGKYFGQSEHNHERTFARLAEILQCLSDGPVGLR